MSNPVRKEWNPRYVAYAKAHGMSPAQRSAQDEVDWPGGCMTGYLLWIQERWSVWLGSVGLPHDYPCGPEQHADFDAWLRTGRALTE